MKNVFIDKYSNDIFGINSNFDRQLISGSIIQLCYLDGLKRVLRAKHILYKDFIQYAKSLAYQLKTNAMKLADIDNAKYIYLPDSKQSNEAIIKSIIVERGNQPGLVAVLGSLETDFGFKTYGNKASQKLELKRKLVKCLHLYFYFIDEDYGLCFFRVQTFFPFKVQVYFNGKEKLALDMGKHNVIYEKQDNCFTWIDDIAKAQELSDKIDSRALHNKLDGWVNKFIPILKRVNPGWELRYHWSIKQIEYATDILFKSESRLTTIFTQILSYCNNTVLPENVMSFLGKKLLGKQSGRIHTSCKRSYNGFRIKHVCGALSIKIYNKAGSVLRIEVTINNVQEINVFRIVKHKSGEDTMEKAPMEKSIYSLIHVARYSIAAINRYLDFLSCMEDNSLSISKLSELTNRKTVDGRNYTAFNPIKDTETLIFQALMNGALIANGFSSKILKNYLFQIFKEQNLLSSSTNNNFWSTSRVSRLLKRLIVFNLIKRIGKSYRYFLTEYGRSILAMFLKLRNMSVIPSLNVLLSEVRLSNS